MSGWTRWRRTPAPIRALADETSKPTGGTFYDDLNRELQDPAVAADFAANAARIQAIDAGRRAEAGRWEPRRDDESETYRGGCGHCGRPIAWKTSHMWGSGWQHEGDLNYGEAYDHDAEPVASAGYVPARDLTDERVATIRERWERAVAEGHGRDALVPIDDRATADLHAIDDRRSLEDRYLALCQQLREVTADRDALDTANGRLLARVGLYRSMLADLGVSPRTVAELERADRQWIGHADTAVLPRVRSHPAPGPSIDVTQPGDEDELLIGRWA